MSDSNKCQVCDDKAQVTAVLGGKFGVYCRKCIASEMRLAAGHKAKYDRDRDREDHRKDMLQPFMPDGTPNTEFIRAYPDTENFTEDEIKKYG